MTKKYKTAPLKSWKKCKELRTGLYRDIAEAKDKGKLLICGSTGPSITLAMGYDHAFVQGEPYGASVAHIYQRDPDLYQEMVEASEHAGYPRDL